MGLDTTCTATFKTQTSEGRAQLETDYVLFRGDFRVKLPLSAITLVSQKAGVLSMKSADGTLALTLGSAAEKWLAKIRTPKRRIDKLGVKPGMRVALVGIDDAQFAGELKAAGAVVVSGARARADHVYLAIESAADLQKFAKLLPLLEPDGAIWAIRRKGLADASEAATMAAGKAAGLVDVKVARFSDTHTAEKYVRPLATRRATTSKAVARDGTR